MRFGIGPFHQVRGELFGPLGFDTRGHARPQPRRFHEFGGHDPAWWLLEQSRSGEDREVAAPGAEVVPLLALA